jgi:serine/threonine-protein kinase
MGTVYKARQVSLDRIVALKVLPQRLAKDSDFLARFYREARATAKLNHPNIVSGFDVGQADGYHYLAMEFVEGTSTAALLAESSTGLPYLKVLDIAVQTAKALAHAHENGLIHRDIKPENLLISESGRVKLCDLGLARSTAKEDLSITQTGIAVGTPHYISPEQARGEQDLDARADVYSLGAAIFHLATGRPVFTGDNAMQVMLKHLNEPPPLASEVAPAVPPEFAAVIHKMLAKRREDRYPGMDAVLQDLSLVAAGRRPAHAEVVAHGAAHAARHVPPPRPVPRKFNTRVMKAVVERRRPVQVYAIVAGAGALLLIVALIFRSAHGPDEAGARGLSPADPARPADARPEPGPGPGPEEGGTRARELFEAAVSYARDNPQAYRQQMARFQMVLREPDAGSILTMRARTRITRAEEELRKTVEAALEPLRKEAAGLRAQKRYGAAAERIEAITAAFPDELLAAAAARAGAGDLRQAGLAEWAGLLAESQELAAKDRFAEARGVLEPARLFGLPAVSLALDRQLEALAQAEKAAGERLHRKALEEYAAFHAQFRKALAGRRYAEAVTLAARKRAELPADLAEKVAADQADLEVVRGVHDKALQRLKDAKPGERLTLVRASGEQVTGRFDRASFDGDRILLMRKAVGEGEVGEPFKFTELSTANLLYLAGLASPRNREEAEKHLLFTAFDGAPTAQDLERAVGFAKMRGADTSRFEALLNESQGSARDREAAVQLARLEEVVKAGHWDEVVSYAQRLTEGFADTPTVRTRAQTIAGYVSQARENIAARSRIELVFQDGEPVAALGIGYYSGTRDSFIATNNPDMAAGKGLELSAFGGGLERTLVSFDLSAVPRDAVVESARLELYCHGIAYGVAGSKLRVCRLTSDWQEGTRSWGTGKDADGVSWAQRYRGADGQPVPWTTPGGDFDAADSGRGPGVIDEIEGPGKGQWARLNVTGPVREIIAGKQPNCGFLVMNHPQGCGSHKFPSREALLAYDRMRPRLVLAVNNLRARASPAEIRAAEECYSLAKPQDAARFNEAIRVLKTQALSRTTAAIKDGALELQADSYGWRLVSGRLWGRDLEVALKVSLPDGGRVALDLGNALPESGARHMAFHYVADRKAIYGSVSSSPDGGGAVRDALTIGGSYIPAETLNALLSPEGAYELVFIKQGARLRLESKGLTLAELGLSARDEQELFSRPVQLLLMGRGRSGSTSVIKVEELRLGPVRPRPAPLDPKATGN